MIRIIVLAFGITCISLGIGLPQIVETLNQWEAENACINTLIKGGVERKDIIRNHGTCIGVLRSNSST